MEEEEDWSRRWKRGGGGVGGNVEGREEGERGRDGGGIEVEDDEPLPFLPTKAIPFVAV